MNSGRTYPKRCATSASDWIDVQFGEGVGQRLQTRQSTAQRVGRGVEQTLFERERALLRCGDSLLAAAKLFRDEPLGVGQSLPPHVLGRNLVEVRAGDLDVVAEHPVVSHLEGGNARARPLVRLEVRQSVAQQAHLVSQTIEIVAVARPDDSALASVDGRLVHEHGGETRRENPDLRRSQSLANRREESFAIVAAPEAVRQARRGAERPQEAKEIGRPHSPHAELAEKPFEIVDLGEDCANVFP